MRKKIGKELRAAFQNQPQPQYVQAHMDETIEKVQSTGQNAHKPSISMAAFIKRQARYFGVHIWGAQSLLTMIACLFLHSVLQSSPNPALSRYLPVLLGWYAVLLATISIPLFFRSAKCRMLELELSTQASLPKIMLSHTILVAFGDALALILVLAVVGRKGIDVLQAISYLLLPFLLTSGGIFHMLGRRSAVACLGYCVGVMLTFGALFLFVDGAVFLWTALCILVLPVCIIQFLHMLRRMRAWDGLIIEGI